MKKTLVMALALLIPASLAMAVPTIVVGDHNLDPNGGPQDIEIYVSGGDAIVGLNFNVLIGDGGPEVGGTFGPQIVGVDIVAGTIFETNNNGPIATTPLPQLYSVGFMTGSGTVAADGLLGTITVDPSGLVGEWVLAMGPGNYMLGATNGADSVAWDITDGMIITPEPASALLLLAAVPFLRRRR